MNLESNIRDLLRINGLPAAGAVAVSSSGVQGVALAGVRRIDRPAAIRPNARFHLGSNTKALTALLAAAAVAGRWLNWDTQAREFLGVGDQTLRQLLAHSSGLRPYTEDAELEQVDLPAGLPAEQRATFARMVLQERPDFEPGSRHRYSNAGYAVAAAMVESATGQSWESALRATIFEPLGIRGVVGWPAVHSATAPLGHWERADRHRVHDPTADPYDLPAWLAPAGGVSLSIGDYGLFLADQLAGLRDRGRLGPGGMYRALHTPDSPDADGDPGFALGWGITQGIGGPVSQHAGSAGTFYAVVVLQPDRDRGLAVVANSARDVDTSAVNALAKSFLAET